MNQQRKNTIIALLEQILPVILAVVCILVMTINTHQSHLAIPLPLISKASTALMAEKPGRC